MIPSLWQRYFLKETFRTLFLFIFVFFGLYVLIDYSINSTMFSKQHFTTGAILYYYLFEFSRRLDVILPFAILIATIRTLCDLAIHQELVALMASGISLRKLLRPFLFIGLLGCATLYLNGEFFIPSSANELKTLGLKGPVKHKRKGVQQLSLSDHTSLLYHDFDPLNDSFQEVYWIASFDEIYHAKRLHPFQKPPKGEYVTRFSRNSQGHITQNETFLEHRFTNMPFDSETIWNTLSTPEDKSISSLYEDLPKEIDQLDEKQSQIATAFYMKLLLPWFCLLAVIVPAPACVQFTRRLRLFLIYACSIFGLIALHLILSAASVLSARQVFSPLFALGIPFATFFSIFLWNYNRKIR